MDLLILWNIFNNNEENENVLQIRRIREQHIRIRHFYENVVLNYSLTGKKYRHSFSFIYILYYFVILLYVYSFLIDFKSHFRITRETFELLIQHIGPSLLQRNNYPKILPATQIAIALWIFGNQEVYRLANLYFFCLIMMYIVLFLLSAVLSFYWSTGVYSFL